MNFISPCLKEQIFSNLTVLNNYSDLIKMQILQLHSQRIIQYM